MPKTSEFFANVTRAGACWLWAGSVSNAGYGQVWFEGKTRSAHRVAYYLANGFFPEQNVLHACDNRTCINPEHLRAGSQQDNIREAVAKGRWPSKRGELNNAAKLSAAQAASIRQRKGERTVDLATEFGVSQSAISMVKHGHNWRP